MRHPQLPQHGHHSWTTGNRRERMTGKAVSRTKTLASRDHSACPPDLSDFWHAKKYLKCLRGIVSG